MDLLDNLQILLRPLRTRINTIVGRAVVTTTDDSKKFQQLQVEILDGETRDDVERVQNYGFTSNPAVGSEAVFVCPAGRRDHAIVIAVDDRRFRLKSLQPGEVAIYTDEGDKVVFKRGGTIEFTASTKVLINAPLVECSTDLKVNGKLDVTGNITGSADVKGEKVLDGSIELGTHTHPYTDVDTPSGGGGGSSTTGAPT